MSEKQRFFKKYSNNKQQSHPIEHQNHAKDINITAFVVYIYNTHFFLSFFIYFIYYIYFNDVSSVFMTN